MTATGQYAPVDMIEMVAMRCNNERCLMVIGAALDHDGNLRDHWPKHVSTKSFPDVPPHIAEAATEAHLVKAHGAYRAAGALARAVVEGTAKEKGITQGRLDSKIDAMYNQGLIRQHIKDAAHEVRHFGNEMAHGDFIEPVEKEEAAEVLQLMDEVLDEVFQSPARVERRKQARLNKVQAKSSQSADVSRSEPHTA